MTDKQVQQEAAPQSLIFDWRTDRWFVWRSWLATLVIVGCFAMMLVAVRVRVVPPVEWATPHASLIYVGGDSEAGRELALRAQAAGPFPSRFLPDQWRGMEELERMVLHATRTEPAPYRPQLRAFPPDRGQPIGLASRGEPVLPVRPLGGGADPQFGALVRVPELTPVSGLAAGGWADPLPDFGAAVDDAMAARAWRFMLRLDEGGRVRDCIALAGSDELGQLAMKRWLRRVAFVAAPGVAERWVAVSVEFRNQVIDDGTDAE